MGSEERTQWLRDREGDKEVAYGEEPFGLRLQPCLCMGVPALRTGTVPAAVKSEVLVAAIITAVKTASAGRGVAAQNGVHGCAVTCRHAAAVLAQIVGTVTPENVGEGHCREVEKCAGVG